MGQLEKQIIEGEASINSGKVSVNHLINNYLFLIWTRAAILFQFGTELGSRSPLTLCVSSRLPTGSWITKAAPLTTADSIQIFPECPLTTTECTRASLALCPFQPAWS